MPGDELKIPYGGKYVMEHGIAYAIEIERNLTVEQHKYLKKWYKENHSEILQRLRGGQP